MGNDKFLEKFDNCILAINKIVSETEESVIENLLEYIGKKHSDLLLSLLASEKGVEENWGKDFSEFEKHLIEFYKMHVRMINRCKNNI